MRYGSSGLAEIRVSNLEKPAHTQLAAPVEAPNAIKLIENALKEARQGAFRVRNCHDFEKMCMPNRRRVTPPEKL